MDWNTVESNWKQLKGKIKDKWGKLTDADLDKINGDREQLAGKIQKEYGYSKTEAEKHIDSFTAGVNQSGCGCGSKGAEKR